MERIYSNAKLPAAWTKEARGRSGNLWWFDLEEGYGTHMKLDGKTPIICNDSPIEIEDCWTSLYGSTCMLLLRYGMKSVMAVVHEKSDGLRFYSRDKAAFSSDKSLEDSPGVFLFTADWMTYAHLGLIKTTKKCLSGTYKPEAVLIDPTVGTLVDWDLSWIIDRPLTALGRERTRQVLEREDRNAG